MNEMILDVSPMYEVPRRLDILDCFEEMRERLFASHGVPAHILRGEDRNAPKRLDPKARAPAPRPVRRGYNARRRALLRRGLG
jgi:hypothetical protein